MSSTGQHHPSETQLTTIFISVAVFQLLMSRQASLKPSVRFRRHKQAPWRHAVREEEQTCHFLVSEEAALMCTYTSTCADCKAHLKLGRRARRRNTQAKWATEITIIFIILHVLPRTVQGGTSETHWWIDRHTVVCLLKDIFSDNSWCSFYVSLLSCPQLIFRSRIVMFKRSN